MLLWLCCPCRFSEIFDGVVLGYDFNILDKCAKILPGLHPYFGVRLKANLLLFSPKPNMLLGNPVTNESWPILFSNHLVISVHKIKELN